MLFYCIHILLLLLFLLSQPPPNSTLFPYTTLFRSIDDIILFSPLTKEQIMDIIGLSLKGLEHRLKDRDMRLELTDRKSTRLNSSHVSISYAVFCLKKKISIKSTSAHDG